MCAPPYSGSGCGSEIRSRLESGRMLLGFVTVQCQVVTVGEQVLLYLALVNAGMWTWKLTLSIPPDKQVGGLYLPSSLHFCSLQGLEASGAKPGFHRVLVPGVSMVLPKFRLKFNLQRNHIKRQDHLGWFSLQGAVLISQWVLGVVSDEGRGSW